MDSISQTPQTRTVRTYAFLIPDGYVSAGSENRLTAAKSRIPPTAKNYID